jgi:hypothetical protein
MSELRLQGKNAEGTHLTLTDNDGSEFTVRISDTLRATVNQPRLTAVPTEDANETISVKEIQRRLRAGELPDFIARDGNTTLDKVMRFAGPILQEREFILSKARTAVMRKDARNDVTFLEAVVTKLVPRGVDEDDITWNTWRLADATWHIECHYPNRDGDGIATWNFDLSRLSISPTDNNGAWLIDVEAPARVIEPGIIHAEPHHPARFESIEPEIEDAPAKVELPGASSLFSPVVEEEKPETPRLVAVREPASAQDAEDGVTARAKIPSWDEIMFGHKTAATEENTSQNSSGDSLFDE